MQIILSKCDNSFNSYINDIGYNDKLITEAKNKELKQIDNLVKNSLFNLCQVKFNDRDSNDANDDEKLSPQSMDTTDRGSGEIVQEGKLSFELIGNGSLELIKSF
ncbi:hypothetical protein [Streptococcus sanguinis]|uniref:hypothetical protein n=1 Tax=Streptococcus sanguinis TaxID=1305 RepID=UPI0039C0315C